MIIEYWNRSLYIRLGWIGDFNQIISRYILMKYFQPLTVLNVRLEGIFCTTVSADGTRIAFAPRDNTIHIWDIKKREEIHLLQGHSQSVKDMKFSSDGNMLVSCSHDEIIRLWDMHSGLELNTFEGHSNYVMSVQFSADDKVIISGSSDETIRLWDVKAGEDIITIQGHAGQIYDAKFSPNQQLIAAATSSGTQIWSLSSYDQIQTLRDHFLAFDTIQFSPDGRCILSPSNDHAIRIWDITLGNQVAVFKLLCRVNDVIYSPDGHTIVACLNDDTIRLWDVALGVEIQTFERSAAMSVAFSSDGNTILSSSHTEPFAYGKRLPTKQMEQNTAFIIIKKKKNHFSVLSARFFLFQTFLRSLFLVHLLSLLKFAKTKNNILSGFAALNNVYGSQGLNEQDIMTKPWNNGQGLKTICYMTKDKEHVYQMYDDNNKVVGKKIILERLNDHFTLSVGTNNEMFIKVLNKIENIL
ncbi:G-protein beta WD-40 repeats containing protein [Reticulomyxa filosa]|uniref:G-protein beta WD-40 repeats containing protein n=1 Tax=Reticulomyxa filosa TaxID=46433 RepID=X6NUW0_RETFI|nr:G-protein beta WD-40 repeats containing protein [Reticulomyxa filosa]|eukprot:ETO29052.1 G-protein beta WD-40 repeats containing protein [Reticulomyxa filosa]